MAIVPSGSQPKPVVYEFDSLLSVGAGAPGVLPAPQGFSATTKGYALATDGFFQYGVGSFLLVRDAADSYLFLVTQGAVSKVAVLIGVLSGGASSLSGAALKYVVYPALPNFLVPPTGIFTSITAAIAQANLENPANKVPIIIAPGPYAESFTVRDGMSLIGLGPAAGTNSGVKITGAGGGTPAITVLQGSAVGLQNINVDGNGATCVFFPNVAGDSAVVAKDCIFTTGGANAFESAGALSAIDVDLRDSYVEAPSSAFSIQAGTKGSLVIRGSQVALGDTLVKDLDARDSTLNLIDASSGATIAGCSTGIVTTLILNMTDSQSTGGFGATAGSAIRRSSFAETCALAGAGASILEDVAIVTTAGDGLTVGAGHTVTILPGTTIRAFTGIALSGAGSAIIVAGLPGGGTINLPAANVTAISGQSAAQESDVAVTGAGAPGDAWPASNPDRVRCTSAGTAANNIQQLPNADLQVPGRELEIKNVSAANSMTLAPLAGSGNTLIDGIAAGDIILGPGDYRRVVARRGVGWEVN